jgi:hypothetical protein
MAIDRLLCQVGQNSSVPIQKWPNCPIPALREKFNPQNINHMPAVKFSVRLDLDQICLFLGGRSLSDQTIDA